MAWGDFAAWLGTPLASADKFRQAFSPLASIRPGKGGRVNAGPAYFLAFEFDGTATPEILARACPALAIYDGLIYTTASATAEVPRFRVVLRVDAPIDDAASWAACVDDVGQVLGAQPASESRQISRIWFRPIAGALVVPLRGGDAWPVARLCSRYPPRLRGRPRAVSATDVAALPADRREAAAWRELERRRPDGAFIAAAICVRDCLLTPDRARVTIRRYADTQGWEIEDCEIEERVTHAGDYASGEPGSALYPPLEPRPPIATDIARTILAALLGAAPTTGPIAVIAPMGAGKTYQAAAMFEAAGSALYVAPTRALVEDALRVLPGSVSYQAGGCPEQVKGVTTLASAHKYGDLAARDLVIVDEVVEIERQIHSDVIERRRATMRSFLESLGSPARTLIMGADLRLEDVARYERWIGRTIHVVDMSPLNLLGRSILETSRQAAIREITRGVREPGRTFIHADSPSKAEAIGEMARGTTGKRVIVVHGKTDRREVARLNDGEWEVLVTTSAMASGVSIDVPVARMFVLRRLREIAADVIAQTLGRCRDYRGGPVVVGQPDWSPGAQVTEPHAIRSDLEQRTRERLAVAGATASVEPIDPVVLDSWVAVEVRARTAHNEPGLRDRCERNGWGWSRDLQPRDLTAAERDGWGFWRELERSAYAAAVTGAEPLSEYEAEEMRRCYAVGEDDQARLARAAIEHHVGADVWAAASPDERAELVLKNRSGRWVSAMRAAAHALDHSTAVGLDTAAAAHEHATQVQGRGLRGALRRALWAACFAPAVPAPDSRGYATRADVVVRVCSWVCSAPDVVRRQLGGIPEPGRELAWLRRQLAAVGVRLAVDGEVVETQWPEARWLRRYAEQSAGTVAWSRSAAGEAVAALRAFGSLRAAEAATGISKSTIHRAANKATG